MRRRRAVDYITGDVTWTLRPLRGVDQLIEYERRVSRVLAGTSGLALCQYDRRRLPDDVVAGGLETHRHTVPTGHAPEAPFRVLPQGPGRFRLVGELDLVDADVMAETLDVALAGGADRLVIDLRDLSFVDVAGLSAMCGPATEGRADVVLRHPRPVVRRMLGLLDLDRLACVRIDDGRGW